MTQSGGRDSLFPRETGYIPLNVRNILSIARKGKPYILDSLEVNQITLVAHVLQFDERDSCIDIVLQDETGRINSKIFKRAGSSVIKSIINYEFRLKDYAFIIGTIMNFNAEDIIVITRIQNIDCYSYVLSHRVHVFWAFMIRKKLLHCSNSNSIISDLTEKFSETVSDDNFGGLNNDQKAVMNFIKNYRKEGGVIKDEIFKCSGVSKDKVKAVLAELVEYGFLYTDCDCEFYYMS